MLVTEYEPPTGDKPARVAWHGWVEGGEEARLDVHHAWLIEDLPGGRVRILTQETQVGKPAQELARTKPNHAQRPPGVDRWPRQRCSTAEAFLAQLRSDMGRNFVHHDK